MAVTVYVPSPFRRATANRDRIEVAARDVAGLLEELERTYEDLRGLVRDDAGTVLPYINVYVNGEEIEDLEGLETRLRDGDEVAIIPAMAGGAEGAVVVVTQEELDAMARQAVEEYPRESCGVILRHGEERRLVRCGNVQDALHARDPVRHPRDARTAYYVDPRDLLRIGRLEAEGWSVAVIYHSHVDTGAYFSETDRGQALFDGEPTYPGVVYVVTSVVAGRVEAVAAFQWDPRQKDFVPLALGEAARVGTERGR